MANPVGPTGTWTQIFEDLFDGTSLDTTKWLAVNNHTINNSNVQASNVSVSGGNCRLILPSCIDSKPSLQGWGSDPSNGPVCLSSGYCVEARINFPGSSGTSPYNWPAWWISGGSWPANGENDIWESYDGAASALNYHGPSGANNGPHPSGNWCNSFHVYTCVRNRNSTSVWWDGVLMRTVSTNDAGGPESLIINVGSGNTSSATAVTLVDYVRVWSPGGTGGSSPAVTTTPATSVTQTTVTLNGTVNPNSLAATYQFEYGTTTGYGTTTPGTPGSAGAGNSALAESAAVTGLAAATTYHYRLNASNSAGATSGNDQAFSTASSGGGGGGGGGALPSLAYSSTVVTAPGVPSLVQSKSATGTSATSITVTLNSPTTAGNCLIVALGADDGTANEQISGITLGGSAGNFAVANTAYNDGFLNAAIWADPNCAGGQTTLVISLTHGNNSVPAIAAWVMEWSGLAATSVVDKAPAGVNTSGTTWSSGSTGTLSQASEVAVGVVYGAISGLSTPGSPWTELGTLTATNGANTALLGAGYQVTSATTAVTYNGTFSPSRFFGTCIATFKAASGGTLTSTSFTPVTGDIIVVKCVGEDSGITFNTPAGGGWTYTSQVSDTTASHVSSRIWTAPVTAGGTPQTVAETPTWGTFSNATMTVELWRGAQLAVTPATCDTRGSGAPSATLATTAANSVVSWASGDWASVNGSGRAYNTTSATPAEDGYTFSAGNYTAYSAYQSAASAGTQTLGLTAPGGQTYTLAGVELQSSGSAGLSYRAAPAAAQSAGAVTSIAIARQAGTVAGDLILIFLQGDGGLMNPASLACPGFTADPEPAGFGGLLYRKADGTEASSFTVSWSGATTPVSAVIVTVTGPAALDPAAPAVPFSGAAATTTIPVPGITLGNGGDLVLWFAANSIGNPGPGYDITPPAGFTSQAASGAQAGNPAIMVADSTSFAAGPTGTQTGTTGTASYHSGVLAGVTAGTTPAATPGAGLATGTGAAQNAAAATSGSSAPRAGLAAGTGASSGATALTPGSGTPAPAPAAAAGTALNATVQAAPGIAWFPAKNLGVVVELLLNNAWTDITAYVYQRNPVQVTGMGRADWTSQIQPAQLTLTLDNRAGRFSPKNSGGAYYPFITRNVQIRVSVAAQSVTGAAYSGVRFWGEVAEWPVRWSLSEHDVYVDIVANGIWRRVSQLQTTLGSAYTRYNSLTLTGASQPRCYWPCEDGTGSGQLVSYDSVAGTANAVQSFVTGQAGLSLAACTDFHGSDGIPQLNAAKITATVPAGGTATVNCTRFLISVPKAGDSASGTTNWNLAEINSSGTIAKFEIYLNATGTLLMQLRNSGGTVIASGTTTTNVKGVPVLASCELTPSGGNVAFAFRIIAQGAAGITESMTGTVTGASVGAITTVSFGRANVLMDTAVGHLSVTYGAVPLMVPAAYALGGYAGEKAMDRFSRICGEMGIAAETIGTAPVTATMGPQVDDTLAAVLQSIEDTDCGLLFESRGQFGLGYRSSASMANQPVSAVFSYPAATLDPALAPTYDDSLTRNNVVVTNWTGYTQQAILTAGPMSISNPPNGIGNGYALTRQVNCADDAQTAGIATFLLNQGAVDEIRFPVVTLKLARPSNAPLFTAVPGLRIGDYFQVTSPPSFLTAAANIRQLAWGYSETLGAREWTFSFNAVPETPWEVGFSPGTTQIAQIPGGSAVTSTAPGAGGLGGIIANGSVTPAMLSGGITVHTLGGNAITISAAAPPSPNTGDIWLASATGLISSWDGTAWQPSKFDASVTVLPGTVVTANIAAQAITTGLIAAGTVAAGIVDATNILANTYIATSVAGEFLAYDVSSPTTGHLVSAIAGAAGTDSASNAFPAGFYGQQLTLANQSSAPAAFSGSSVFYSGPSGRPRYLAQSGADLVLERSGISTVQFNQGNVVTAQPMSGILAYLANEAQVSSEFEIEIFGLATAPSTIANVQTLDWRLYMDGSNFGGGFTIGATVFSSTATNSQPFAYTVRFVISVQSAGAGGAVHIHSDGSFAATANKTTSDTANLGGDADAVAFDSTASHNWQLRAFWNGGTGSGAAGQGLTTYRTKLVRRN
jgi:hypothetical protein